MAGNMQDIAKELDALVSALGLEKSAGIQEDPGTGHPAKLTPEKANLQAGKEGARSAENSKDVKEEVRGQAIDEAKPEDANNSGAKSSTENITTATETGQNVPGYQSKQKDPGTKHPADLNKSASLIFAEIEKLEKAAAEAVTEKKEEATEKKPENPTKADKKEDGETTVGERIAEMAVGKEAKAEDKEAAVKEKVGEYLTGYVKAAALLGELTADYLDGVQTGMGKKAEDAMPGMVEGAAGTPAEAPAGAEAAPAGGQPGLDEESQALYEAAAEIAQELGVTPEEVLQAAMAEAQGGGQAGAEGAPEAPVAEEAAAEGEPVPQEAAEKMAAENEELKKKAAAYDELMKKQAETATKEENAAFIANTVKSTMDAWFAKQAAELGKK